MTSSLTGTDRYQTETPVALFVFNRPKETAQVLAAIAQAKPKTLLIIADGPRPSHPADIEKCAEVRRILEKIDWQCEVHRRYAETNQRAQHYVARGISWVFEQTEEAIFLEDDCIPDPTFFPFCEELLAYYRHDSRIMSISACNFSPNGHAPYSYHFSRYLYAWGWASWRRAWQHFDLEMRDWPRFRKSGELAKILGNPILAAYWSHFFQRTYDNVYPGWDYRWMLSCMRQRGLTIVPSVNLVTNIGFTPDATNTRKPQRISNFPTSPLTFPLRHPPVVERNRKEDFRRERRQYRHGLQILMRRLKERIKQGIKRRV